MIYVRKARGGVGDGIIISRVACYYINCKYSHTDVFCRMMVEKKSFETILFSIWKHSSENSNIGDITDRSSQDIELLKREEL